MRKLLLIPLVLSLFMCGKQEEEKQEEKNDDKKEIIQKDLYSGIESGEPTQKERELYELMMQYRRERNLPDIPISKSLSIVAQTHVRDLAINTPVGGDCNMHSWSDKGKWAPVCYSADHKRASLMWSKPKELTSYVANGYEIAAGGGGGEITPEVALKLWKNSQGHNDVIINGGIWKDKWNAIGIGIYKGYAVVWFGKEKDNAK